MVCSNVSDRGGRRCPASRDDAAGQIWGLYRSGKQTKPDPALRPSSRYKSTKNHSKPVAPCPLESSTVHGDALNKAESSCVTKAATLGSFLSGQKYWFNHSTKMEVLPATTSSICDSVLNNRRSMLTEQPQISQSEASQIGAATFKSETSLTASLRSSRSGFLATSFDKSAHRTPSTDRHLCNGVREQCFLTSLNQTSPTNLSWNFLHQPSDTISQTSKQDLDDTSNESRSGQTMDVVSFPLPPPTTLTPTPPAPARRSMPSTMTPASTHHLVLPSTMTPASTQHLGGGASDTAKTVAALGFCLLGPRRCSGPPVLSRPTDENINSTTSPSRPRTEYFTPKLFCRLSPRSENSIVDDLAKKSHMVYDQAHLCSL